MTDGGHVPGEGLPEHLHAGPDPLGAPEGVAGVAPLQGVATDGGVIPNPAVPAGVMPPGAGVIPPQGQPNFTVPGMPPQAVPGEGWAVDQGAARPAFHFVDQPDGLDDEDDVLLMPGPQGSWGAEQAPFAAQPDGTPVEPSWPPVDPPVLGGEHAQQQPVQPAPAQPYAQQPMTQAQPPRRPLHAGPPIPDPSLMTGQVPVRSLADRGPSQGGTPAHGIPVVGRPPMGEAVVPVPGAVPQGVQQAAPMAPPAAPVPPVAATVEGGPEVHQVPQGQGYQQVPLAGQPVEGVMGVETVGAIEVVEVVEMPEAVQAAQAGPVAEAAQAVVVEPVPADAAAQPAAEAVAVESAAVETVVVEAVAAGETAVVEAVAVEGGAVEAVAAEGVAEGIVPVEQPEGAAPAGQPRRISAFLAAPTPHGLPTVEAAQQAPVTEEAGQEQPAPIAAADVPQAAEQPVAVEAVQEVEQAEQAEQVEQTVEAAEAVEAVEAAETVEAAQAVVVEPVAETAAGTGEMPSGQVVAEPVDQEPAVAEPAAVEPAVAEPVAVEPVAEGEQAQPEAVPAEQSVEAAAEPVAEQAVEAVAEQIVEAEAVQSAEAVAPEGEPQPAAEPVAETAEQPSATPAAEAPATEEPQAEAVAVAPEAVQGETPAAEQATEQPAGQPEAQPEQPVESPAAEAPATDGPQPEQAADQQPADQQSEQPVESSEAPAAEDEQPAEPAEPRGPAAPGYDEAGRDAVHQVIRERRDIRNGFRPDPIPHEVLIRVLEAAHTAPSVGYSQPWDFVVIRSAKTRKRMHALAERQREAYADSLPKGRAKQFREIKIEAILETPVNIVVTADRTRGGRHTLGRHTQPQMAPYSAALAVENLWLAARAEGLGVGWVSFFDDEELVRELGLPEHLEVVAYLCVGFVDSFPDEPELEQQGWAKKRPLAWVVHEEQYGNRALPGEEPQSLLADTLRGIRPLDAKALGEAWDRQKRMTKPAGSLGMLEIISAQLCGLSRKCPPPIPEPACVAIFAADHGVHAQGVSPWPQEVTAQMVGNFLAGGAVINSFAKQIGTEVCVVDVGVAAELPQAVQQGRATGLLPRKVKPGTDDMTQGPAMTREEALQAIEVGIETARDLVAAGNKALVTGDMGIANTTASAALISVFTGLDPAEVTGRGTGIDDETHAHKIEVIRAALALHQPDPNDPIGVLAAVGGLEHAAIAGFLLGAASLRTPVVLDGVIAGSAALVAKAIAPEALAACIAGHRSAEPGHQAALAKLGLRPLIDLDLRLGEGTGALLALPLVQSAARAMHDVATFDSAGVTEKA
ncbi:nicotinate-nucleotide--dimethylbenzimidazole phosphoribosyltransferase [Kitasatospora cathayae]|uniref:Nicotinate-nucleotide--dimethylbenzimidazole phosphoribosyltransferase n=1 Tax=Kitasatospora cathayae TaxID=3004092 RepID=A0ABY7QAS3_9ACTN|nr:nicotinate-nucleotide--dimethylbenzimidazole phosphoribosyltransferase [Kitasatospora sp. HUAS 3-15]WBP89838.1 nicotinate-nucleotide--dimethylbenzimidazole phosphoribosyltransferase [Kitasatospora sp. HUAS 3-15]